MTDDNWPSWGQVQFYLRITSEAANVMCDRVTSPEERAEAQKIIRAVRGALTRADHLVANAEQAQPAGAGALHVDPGHPSGHLEITDQRGPY
jgi:hypothetical protein